MFFSSYWKLALEVLEREDSPRELRERSVRALLDLFRTERGDELDQSPGLGERILNATVDEMKRCYEPPRDPDTEQCIVGTITISLCWVEGRSAAIANLIDDESFLPWVVECIKSEHSKLHDLSLDLLRIVCAWGTPSDRVAIVIRHTARLQSAIVNLMTREYATLPDALLYEDDEEGLFEHFEMAGLLALSPRSLWAWVETWKSKDEESTASVCYLIVRVYNSALESPKKLQELLGLGHLPMTVRFFSRLPAHDVHTEADDVFNAILLRHPEFSQQFWQATHDGTEGNSTTAIGRNIRPRRDRPGCLYIQEDEDMETL